MLFVDFDGTLSPLVEAPSEARLDPAAENSLRRLVGLREVAVAVISGRSVNDVASRVGLPITYAGDHGLQIRSPALDFTVPEADALRRELPGLCNEIRERISDTPGALVELKRLTASVHFRQVREERVPGLLRVVEDVAGGTGFEVRKGNCVFEVRPRTNWTKGEAVAWLLRRDGAVPEQAICVGDDETDEDMFRRNPTAVNIRVAEQPGVNTAASYVIRRKDVASVLNCVGDAAEGASGPRRHGLAMAYAKLVSAPVEALGNSNQLTLLHEEAT